MGCDWKRVILSPCANPWAPVSLLVDLQIELKSIYEIFSKYVLGEFYFGKQNILVNMLLNFNRRLEDAISQRESEKRDKLDKWQDITEKTSIIIVDSRSKLRHIKEKDPHTTPEIKEQLEEIQVKNVTKSEN